MYSAAAGLQAEVGVAALAALAITVTHAGVTTASVRVGPIYPTSNRLWRRFIAWVEAEVGVAALATLAISITGAEIATAGVRVGPIYPTSCGLFACRSSRVNRATHEATPQFGGSALCLWCAGGSTRCGGEL